MMKFEIVKTKLYDYVSAMDWTHHQGLIINSG